MRKLWEHLAGQLVLAVAEHLVKDSIPLQDVAFHICDSHPNSCARKGRSELRLTLA